MDKRVILNRMRRNPFFVVGSIAAVVVVVLLVFGPALLHFDPEANSLSERFLPPEGLPTVWTGISWAPTSWGVTY